VLQSLIISWSQENHNFKSLSCEAIVHYLITIPLVTKLMEL
jgi:hypothetical protein